MMLSRFLLNGASHDVKRCIADSHHLHARTLSMFPCAQGDPARAKFGVLHRLEISEQGRVTLLVQSRDAPDISKLPAAFLDPDDAEAACTTSLDRFADGIVAGARLRFRLRANPTRKVETKTGTDGKRRNGRRVPVRNADERFAWLVRKLDAGGLRIVENDGDALVRQYSDGIARGRRASGIATHDAHVFEGVVDVVDPVMARKTLETGIGPGKAFGFGLLSLARTGTT